jgi:hypothetical protein
MQNRKNRTLHQCVCEVCQHHPYSGIAQEHRAINRVMLTLNEKNRRRFAGVLAQQWGRGGIQRVIEITGLSRNTICRGYQEAQHRESRADRGRVRHPGGGRLPVEKNSQVWKTL